MNSPFKRRINLTTLTAFSSVVWIQISCTARRHNIDYAFIICAKTSNETFVEVDVQKNLFLAAKQGRSKVAGGISNDICNRRIHMKKCLRLNLCWGWWKTRIIQSDLAGSQLFSFFAGILEVGPVLLWQWFVFSSRNWRDSSLRGYFRFDGVEFVTSERMKYVKTFSSEGISADIKGRSAGNSGGDITSRELCESLMIST